MQSISTEVIDTLTTIRDYIRWAASRFTEAQVYFGHGSLTAIDEAAGLVLHTLHLPYNVSPFYLEAVLIRPERQAVIDIVERRVNERKPAAYLTHEAVFAGLPFYVDERVLVPRSPIAELIEQRFAPWVDEDNVDRILDLCTGSGCIAIACAYAFPTAAVDAVDLSPEALAVAGINVAKHQSEDSVALYRSDLFESLPGHRYDIIVSNPPYVAVAEWENLPPEYHAEPEMGFTGGKTGLDIVLRILAQAKGFLSEQGILVVEVGSSAQTLQDRFPDIPFYWLDFERGGDGVFLLTGEQLALYHDQFIAALD
ncbi:MULTISPECIES: 50S ribosomal protein L3 N(5)-glutamine methyltransferase [Methylomicrobium]|uniref:Ribosomal protein uL3 glutamine methyltransferase n=1 Tax=Methylomicrobium album BG8 TaxID=686340 RepID=H8GGJ8_METAL|nr:MULTISPECIES: 50S ribosomal protein L3 N(5)-glutamine methyltransferase [Methylomicrobium]EIC28794.1 protein-(glutamine-N5) methyltransferase, ribosomal protein L3-specific [Methylomicrobium album BG8]